MCGLFASLDRQKIEQLFDINYKRGLKGFSQSGFKLYQNAAIWETRWNSERFEVNPKLLSDFNVFHTVAPTSVTSEPRYHPAFVEGGREQPEALTALWHNGLLKDETIKSLQEESGSASNWDTELMVQKLHTLPFDQIGDFLSSLDGSFACILFKDSNLFVFRNKISPLFSNNMLDISSVKFIHSSPVPDEIVFSVDFENNKLEDTGVHFVTKDNPYDI